MNAPRPDVLIVGGGIVGMGCAHYLAREGLAVTVIDRGRMGHACSWGNCGLVCSGHVLPLTMPGAVRTALLSVFNPRASFRVRPRASLAFYRWLFQFARRCNHSQAMAAATELKRILDLSTAEYRQLFADGVLEADYRPTGTAYLFRNPGELRHFEVAEVAPARQLGVNITRYSQERLGDLDPGIAPDTVGAFHFEDDAVLDPGKLCQDWARRLGASGIRMLEETSLTGVETGNGGITAVRTSAGRVQAGHYVFALGAWSPLLQKLAGITLPVEAGKGYSVFVDSPSPAPRLPMLFPETNVVATPLQAGLRLGSMMEFAGHDTSLPETRLRQLVTSAAPFLGLDPGSDYRQAWYGWRPMTWDSLPVIGRAPQLANAWIATGHNMLGTTLAPATGKLLTDLVMRRAPCIAPNAYSPARF